MTTYAKDSNEKILQWRQDLHEQEEWERYEWKCIGCEKSLTHIHFDNDALMPYLEDPFSDHPSTPSARSIPSYALLSEGDSSSTAQGLQDAKCHQLLCNECKYDDEAKEIRFGDKPACPVRSSRYIKYDSFLYRYFPGLADILRRKEFTDRDPPRHWPTYMCTDLHEINWSTSLALHPIWRQKHLVYLEFPRIFGELELIDKKKSYAYVRRVHKEFETSGGECGLNWERFREEGFTNFTSQIEPDGQQLSPDEERIRNLETCTNDYIWLLKAEEIVGHKQNAV